jgi:uncharacterized membrane protein
VFSGSALYLAGAIGVTIAANVPMNDALAAVQPDGAGAASRWGSYRHRWTGHPGRRPSRYRASC